MQALFRCKLLIFKYFLRKNCKLPENFNKFHQNSPKKNFRMPSIAFVITFASVVVTGLFVVTLTFSVSSSFDDWLAATDNPLKWHKAMRKKHFDANFIALSIFLLFLGNCWCYVSRQELVLQVGCTLSVEEFFVGIF